MTNKFGHKKVHEDKYGSVYLSNENTCNCKFYIDGICQITNTGGCSMSSCPISEFDITNGYELIQGAYYYDDTEEKINKFLEDS